MATAAWPVTRRTLLSATVAVATATIGSGVKAAPVERFPLWPGPPPGGKSVHVRDAYVSRTPDSLPDDIAWPHFATPMLNVIPALQPNGGAILLIPGGGYARVGAGFEGSAQARLFAARGFTTFELLYRLPHDGWSAGPDAPLQDAQRAMRLIRARARQWRIDPARVAAIGFSAGGHLAARLASRAALTTYEPVDAADRQSARPIAVGLFFPVITLHDPAAHAPSRCELLGTDMTADRVLRFSAETDLPTDMPPAFLAHAANDPVVSPANSITMFTALQAAAIPAELHIFEKGGHSLPLQDAGSDHPWPDLFLRFAKAHGLARQ